MNTKKCKQCGEVKSLSDYYGNGYGQKYCKVCVCANVKEHRKNNIDKIKAYDRERGNLPHRAAARKTYAATDRGKAAMKRGAEAWAKRNPEKRKAQHAVSNAIRDGRLFKQPCEYGGCGWPVVQAHHDDYSKPLEVRWLCLEHHAEHHKKERETERKTT